MKTKLVFTTLIILLSTLFITSKCKNSEKYVDKDVYISRVTENVLFMGVDNPVYIHVNGKVLDDLIVEIKGGMLMERKSEAISNYTHFIRPESSAKSVEIVIFDKSNRKEIGKKIFEVKIIPSPEVTIADLTPCPQYKKDFFKKVVLNKPELRGKMKYFDFNSFYEIKSFSMLLNKPKNKIKKVSPEDNQVYYEYEYEGDIMSFYAYDKNLTQEMLTAIENATKGTRIWFERISLKSRIDGHIRPVSSIFIKLS